MSKVGWKRSDRRWEDSNGIVWASEFEHNVYRGLCEALGEEYVSKCEAGGSSSFSYNSPVKSGLCLSCGSRATVQQRVYTPDIRVVQAPGALFQRAAFIETKGYADATKRNLLRCFINERPDFNLVLIFQSNRAWKGLKKRPIEWCASYLKRPAFVWDGKKNIPGELVSYLTEIS